VSSLFRLTCLLPRSIPEEERRSNPTYDGSFEEVCHDLISVAEECAGFGVVLVFCVCTHTDATDASSPPTPFPPTGCLFYVPWCIIRSTRCYRTYEQGGTAAFFLWVGVGFLFGVFAASQPVFLHFPPCFFPLALHLCRSQTHGIGFILHLTTFHLPTMRHARCLTYLRLVVSGE
jgi:hypothetical protein